MAIQKRFTIKTEKERWRSDRSTSTTIVNGTLEQLNRYFGYTLEVGHSWNSKIPLQPKTIKSFVSALQKSYEEKEANCYERTFVELLDVMPEGADVLN